MSYSPNWVYSPNGGLRYKQSLSYEKKLKHPETAQKKRKIPKSNNMKGINTEICQN
jgi:hypothetical protein